jgi:hypothetical protein
MQVKNCFWGAGVCQREKGMSLLDFLFVVG